MFDLSVLRCKALAYIGVWFVFGGGACPAGAQTPYIVVYNETTAPMVPLMAAVYADIGIHPVFELVPSERAISETNRGRYDADLSRVPMPQAEYPNLIYTHEPLKKTELYAYVKKGSSLVIKAPSDIKGHTVNMLRGSKLAQEFATQEGLELSSSNSAESFYNMLLAGRFEVALITNTQLMTQEAAVNASAQRVGPVLMSSHSYHVLNRKHADLVPKLDAALKAMKADGRFASLLYPASPVVHKGASQ